MEQNDTTESVEMKPGNFQQFSVFDARDFLVKYKGHRRKQIQDSSANSK
jgi:hypothetical protein